MKLPFTLCALSLTALLTTPVLAAEEADLEARVQASRAAIKTFAETLQGHLKLAVEEGGPTKAIAVCNTKAPEIADSVSLEKNMAVARTSLKTRNESNRPDAWEQAVLEAFEARKAAGEDPMKIDHYEVVERENGSKAFRYMKAIPTGEACLACHGSDIKPEVVARLDELYPQDQARGFGLGDLRGAFTITQPLE